MTGPASHLDATRQRLRDLAQLLDAARAACDEATVCLEGAVQARVQAPLETALASDAPASDHRREHRPGRPRKIDADPELQAFIRARIDRLTCHQIADEIARTFPPARRVAKSAIHAWWQANRKALSENP